MEAQSSYRRGEAPGQFCGWSPPKLDRAAGVSSLLLFAFLSVSPAATAVSCSIGAVALLLLLVGLLYLALKKWRHESESNELAQELEM